MYGPVLKSSNLAYMVSLAQGQILQKYGFPCTLRAVEGYHMVLLVKCTAVMLLLADKVSVQRVSCD